MPSDVVTYSERSMNCQGRYYYHYMGFAKGKGCGNGNKAHRARFGSNDKGEDVGRPSRKVGLGGDIVKDGIQWSGRMGPWNDEGRLGM